MKKKEDNQYVENEEQKILLIKQMTPKLLENSTIITANYNAIERDIKKCLKIMKYYRVFIYDLNNNKVQNFSDRMKNLRRLEKIERVDFMRDNINNILKENWKYIKEINKIAKKIN